MYSLPQNIIPELKCSQCKEILSPPVYTKKNSENVCGKCTPATQKNMVRNILFEDFAKLFLFPCKYEEQGCKDKLKWEELLKHETNCPTVIKNLMACPSLPSGKCQWKGTPTQLLTHFKSEHPALNVNHPYVIKDDSWVMSEMKKLSKMCCRNFIIAAHGFIFLIKFKICFQTDTMWISVEFIGEPKLSVHFEYNVELLSNKPTENVINVLQVLPNNDLFDEKCAFKSMFRKNIKIFISRNKVKCTNCNTVFETISSNQFCCETFNFIRFESTKPERIIHRCPFYEIGCGYMDSESNMIKHMSLLCKYNFVGICPDCKCINPLGSCMFDHFKTHCKQTFTTNIFEDIFVENIDTVNNAVWINERGTFVCKWGAITRYIVYDSPVSLQNINQLAFFFDGISNIPEDENQNLVINITFKDIHSRKVIKKKLKKRNLHRDETGKFVADWHIIFRIPLPWNFRMNYALKVEIE